MTTTPTDTVPLKVNAGADVCTDPDCFAAKKVAHLKREAQALEAAGKTVIDGSKARAALSADGTVKGAYVALKDVRGALKTAQAKAGKTAAKPAIVTIQDPRTGERRRLAEARRAAERAAREALLEATLSAAALTERSAFDLQLIAHVAFAGVSYTARNWLAHRTGHKSADALANAIGSMSAASLPLFVLTCALADKLGSEQLLAGPAKRLQDVAEHYGVGAAAVRKAHAAATPTPTAAARAPRKAASSKPKPRKAAKPRPTKTPPSADMFDEQASAA